MIGSLVKYATIHHFSKPSFILHIFGQSLLLVVFLGLVFGMTFKKNLYGNFSTLREYDTGWWEYGQSACFIIVSVALVVEFLVFIVAFGQMLFDLFIMVSDILKKPKNKVYKIK